MYRRSIVNETTLILLKSIQEDEIQAEVISNCEFIVCHKPLLPEDVFEKVHIQNITPPIDFYYDDDRNLFITDYDGSDEVLENPIQLIAVYWNSVKIYVGNYVLITTKENIHSNLLIESFYLNNRFNMRSDRGPQAKKKKYFENRISSESQRSEELGIFTDSICSVLSESGTSCRTSASIPSPVRPVDISPNSEGNNATELSNGDEFIRKTCPIPESRIDAINSHRLKVEWAHDKMISLFEKFKFPSKDKLVAPEKLMVTKIFPESDSLIKNMITELNKTLGLGEMDPIIIIESESAMKVLSGSRRVQAYKSVGINQIRVCSIKPEEETQFNLYHFFNTNFKSRLEPETKDSIAFLRSLFGFLQLTSTELQKWTSQEMKTVFSICLGENVKSYLLLEICTWDRLADAIESTYPYRSKMSLPLTTEVLRKHKINPLETLEILRQTEPNAKESEIKKSFSTIQPDARHLLSKKGVPAKDTEELIKAKGSDPLFPAFTKALDPRANKKTLRVDSILKRFEDFKKKSKHLSTSLVPNPIIIISSDTSDCELLLTDRMDQADRFLNNNDNATVVLLGQTMENSCIHTLIVEDKLGFRDERGVLNNHCSLSILCKKNGKALSESDLSDVFTGLGGTRKSIMTSANFHCFLKDQLCARVDFINPSLLKISCGLLSASMLISVENQETRELLVRHFPTRISSKQI